MEDGNIRFSLKRKRQYSRIAFCMEITQLFILSYLTIPCTFNSTRALLCFSSHRASFCFSSTIDENTDTVYLIEGFAYNETVTH